MDQETQDLLPGLVPMITASDLLARVARIRDVQAKVMQEGADYGVIPGCGDKPTLLKPGAETLLLAFEMAALPEQGSIVDLGNEDEIRYRVVVPIIHIPTQRHVGSGVGECSSNEDKYKWRKAVCEEEWQDADPARRRLKWGKDRTSGDTYTIPQVRTNKADIGNTILKMAKKRAIVDGALTTTAASRIFTQDIEDFPEEMRQDTDRPADHAQPRFRFGDHKGKTPKDLTTEQLCQEQARFQKLADDPTNKYRDNNLKLVEAIKAELAGRPVPAVRLAETAWAKGDANLFEGYCARMRASKDPLVIREEQKLAATDARLSTDQSVAIQDLAVELLAKKI